MKIWFDSKLQDVQALPVSAMSHALHYGTGVFEGIRSYGGPHGCFVFRLRDHIDRLLRSVETLGIAIPYTRAELEEAVRALLAANRLNDAYIRPLVFVGEGSMGLDIHSDPVNRIHTLIAAWEWKSYFGIADRRGLEVKVGEWTRCFPKSGLNRTKASGFYIDSFLAHLDAKRSGFDDAIMIDERGLIAEATAANVFLVDRGVVATPRADSALPGITRDTVMALATQLGLTVEEREITPDELLAADEVFLTGTACEVAPVTRLNEKTLANGAPGAVTEEIAKAYQKVVRNDHPLNTKQSSVNWCVPVPRAGIPTNARPLVRAVIDNKGERNGDCRKESI